MSVISIWLGRRANLSQKSLCVDSFFALLYASGNTAGLRSLLAIALFFPQAGGAAFSPVPRCEGLWRGTATKPSVIRINTSNPGKKSEFTKFALRIGARVDFSDNDLDEIDADPLFVIAHKASRFSGHEQVVVDDTSLFVDGSEIGVNVRWRLESLKELIGRKAVWIAHIAYRQGNQVMIFRGEVKGTIVFPREAPNGTGFGFDSVFLPEGAIQTLGEAKPDEFNARAIAFQKFLNQEVDVVHPVIEEWSGPWQSRH